MEAQMFGRYPLRDSRKLRHEGFPLEPVWKMKHKR
jgi:hypothetical protein